MYHNILIIGGSTSGTPDDPVKTGTGAPLAFLLHIYHIFKGTFSDAMNKNHKGRRFHSKLPECIRAVIWMTCLNLGLSFNCLLIHGRNKRLRCKIKWSHKMQRNGERKKRAHFITSKMFLLCKCSEAQTSALTSKKLYRLGEEEHSWALVN